MILNYDDALASIATGETDWETLTARVGRNDLPAILAEVAWAMDDDQLAAAIRDAWVSAENPENCLDRDEWLSMFDQIGYRHNLKRAVPPPEVVLYRGGGIPDRMAWTADRELAEWFRDRYPGGRLWTATVRGDALMAYYDDVRTGMPDEPRRQPRETEYVVDPGDLEFIEVCDK